MIFVNTVYKENDLPKEYAKGFIQLLNPIAPFITEEIWNTFLGHTESIAYSKYHLHRMFTSTVGMTIHDYVQRRQLTEAAKLLVFSDRPIIEVAFICGYESQQAFSSAFKSMYKIPPAEYRDNREFYPLQLRFALHRNVANKVFTKDDICLAEKADIPAWMNLMRLVIDG